MVMAMIAGSVAAALAVHWFVVSIGTALRRRIDPGRPGSTFDGAPDDLVDLASLVAGAIRSAGGHGVIRAWISVQRRDNASRSLETVIDLDRARPAVVPLRSPTDLNRAEGPGAARSVSMDSMGAALAATGPPPGSGHRSLIVLGPTCAALAARLSPRLLDGTTATVVLGTIVTSTEGGGRATVLSVTVNHTGLLHAAASDRAYERAPTPTPTRMVRAAG